MSEKNVGESIVSTEVFLKFKSKRHSFIEIILHPWDATSKQFAYDYGPQTKYYLVEEPMKDLSIAIKFLMYSNYLEMMFAKKQDGQNTRQTQ